MIINVFTSLDVRQGKLKEGKKELFLNFGLLQVI